MDIKEEKSKKNVIKRKLKFENSKLKLGMKETIQKKIKLIQIILESIIS